jgi:pyruvate formate lyase activating enzyme
MPITLERAIAGVSKYRHGLKIMHGGFTLSGGEPLMQDRFAVRLFAAVKEMGVHTALDTNGTLGARLSDEELEKIDLVMLCIKHMDPERHRQLVGRDLEPTLDFAKRLSALKRPIWLRFVLVPGWTDSKENISQMAEFVAALGVCQRVDMLPFHQLGRFKWRSLGLDYKLENVNAPDADEIAAACEIFRSAGLEAY